MASKSYAPRNWARAAADLYLAMADGGLQVNVSCMPAVQTKYPSLRCNFAMVSPDAVNFIHY